MGMTFHITVLVPLTLRTKFSESCPTYSKLNTAIQMRKVSVCYVAKNKPFSLDIFYSYCVLSVTFTASY